MKKILISLFVFVVLFGIGKNALSYYVYSSFNPYLEFSPESSKLIPLTNPISNKDLIQELQAEQRQQNYQHQQDIQRQDLQFQQLQLQQQQQKFWNTPLTHVVIPILPTQTIITPTIKTDNNTLIVKKFSDQQRCSEIDPNSEFAGTKNDDPTYGFIDCNCKAGYSRKDSNSDCTAIIPMFQINKQIESIIQNAPPTPQKKVGWWKSIVNWFK